MKILLIEDDAKTGAYIVRGLKEQGHVIDHLTHTDEKIIENSARQYDVMIVDRMLPGVDGLSLVKLMRRSGIKTPILFLTTMGGIDDRVEGLNAGGDDYLVKPFSFFELLARINALARRPPLANTQTVLRVGDLEMDLLSRRVTRSGKFVDLQQKEFVLLEFLMRHADQVVTRTMLLEGVWDYHFHPRTNIVETHMSRLRSKVDRGHNIELIHTIRGSGYAIRTPAETV
jgi:two-component system OmpR family response regulator